MEWNVISTSVFEVGVGGCVCWSKLPHDLWYEVLSRLPKKPLLEFRCVSKAFYSFITELFIPKLSSSALISGFIFHWYTDWVPPGLLYWPVDVQSYIRYSPIPPESPEDFVVDYFHDYVAFCRNGDNGCFNSEFISSYLSLLPFKMSVDDTMNGFLGCFNGIILVTYRDSYYLCNPATKQCITIPVNPTHLNEEKNKINPYVALAFDPLDPPPHFFKIVRCSNTTRPEDELDVFSSDTGIWVKHSIHLDDEIRGFELVRRSVYLNGVFYMLSMANCLVCFNLRESYSCSKTNDAKLKARAIKLPQTSYSTRDDDFFGLFEASNRCLYYATEIQRELLVWTFQANCKKASPWLFKYRININELQKHENGSTLFHKNYMVHAVDFSEEIIFFGQDGRGWSYAMNTNQFRLLFCLDSGLVLLHENSFYPYSCCLVKLANNVQQPHSL